MKFTESKRFQNGSLILIRMRTIPEATWALCDEIQKESEMLKVCTY